MLEFIIIVSVASVALFLIATYVATKEILANEYDRDQLTSTSDPTEYISSIKYISYKALDKPIPNIVLNQNDNEILYKIIKKDMKLHSPTNHHLLDEDTGLDILTKSPLHLQTFRPTNPNNIPDQLAYGKLSLTFE